MARRSKYSLVVLASLCVLFVAPLASAQTATIDLSVERDFVYRDGVYQEIGQSILPVAVTVSNPGSTTLEDLEFTVTLSAGTSVGNVDRGCLHTEETLVEITCTIDELKANRSTVVDFFIDGPNSLEAGQGISISIVSADASVLEPDAFEASLADGDRKIRGANLFVHLVRNIDLDINQNTVPDVDEAILNLPASTPVDELLSRDAVIDVLFIHTPAAAAYLGRKLKDRADHIISSANQLFRENDVAIKLNSVGLEEIPYTANDSLILNTFDALQARTDPAFDELDSLISLSGGDIVVMMHAVDPNASATECGWTSLNGVGRQGDFQSALHRGKLVSAINLGPDCLGAFNLAPVFASNMGIARERERSPDGGTFSYSAGYGLPDAFRTLGTAIGTSSLGSASVVNRFSNPDSLCLGVACGVDRGDLVNGADAVYSLNRTRHLVSAITPTVFPVAPSAIEEKISELGNVYDLEVTQSTLETSAIVNEFTEFEVTVRNTSQATLSDIDLQLEHVNGGDIVKEAHNYESESALCEILGSNLSVAPVIVEGATQKVGTLSCTIERIAPGEVVSFNYRIQIDGSPPVFNTQTYYQEVVTVNGVPQVESLACLPVFLNFVDANVGSTVCSEVQNQPLSFGPQGQAALDQEATVTGNRLSVPFIRLDDGSLISAEFQITFFGEVRFELLNYQVLDSTLVPIAEATLTDAGVLTLSNLLVDGIRYIIEATLEPGSDPVRLGALNITALSADP